MKGVGTDIGVIHFVGIGGIRLVQASLILVLSRTGQIGNLIRVGLAELVKLRNTHLVGQFHQPANLRHVGPLLRDDVIHALLVKLVLLTKHCVALLDARLRRC